MTEAGLISQRIRAAVGVYFDGGRMDRALAALAADGAGAADVCLFVTVDNLRQLYPRADLRIRIAEQGGAELIPTIEHQTDLGRLLGRVDDRLEPVSAYSKTGLVLANAARGRLFGFGGDPKGVEFGDWLQHYLLARHARDLANQIDLGGALVWVGLNDEEHERQVCRVLLRNNDFRTQVHDLPAFGPSPSVSNH